jgi:hypothetical protein
LSGPTIVDSILDAKRIDPYEGVVFEDLRISIPSNHTYSVEVIGFLGDCDTGFDDFDCAADAIADGEFYHHDEPRFCVNNGNVYTGDCSSDWWCYACRRGLGETGSDVSALRLAEALARTHFRRMGDPGESEGSTNHDPTK